jgi:hypothetical protein
MLINEFKLKEAIINKFGSQAEFAKRMGVTGGALTKAIRLQSPKFINTCKKLGIDIHSIIESEAINQGPRNEIKSLQNRIKELERLVDHQDSLIRSYESILKDKLKESK